MGVEMQNCPFTRVFVKRASTGLLLFQLIYVSPLLSLCHSLVSHHPSLCVICFHYSLCMCFSIFILSLCMKLNHIFLLLVSCHHYFHSTACTCKPLLSIYQSGSLASFLLFFPGFVVSINIFLWLILPSLFCFNCHIPFLTHLPFFFPSYLLSPVPPFYPFLVSVLLSYCPMPPHLCRPCNICTASIYSLPYISLWISNVTKCNLGEFNTRQCWPVVSTTNRIWGSLGL